MSSSVSPPKAVTPVSSGARCAACPFAKDGQPNKPVPGEGPRNAKGLIIAESPGDEEAARGRPLVGTTGKEFDNSMQAAGILRSTVWIGNAIACRPQGPKSEANMKRATECCRPFLLAQIRRYGPHPFVFTMGAWAYYSLHGHKLNIDRGRGFLRPWHLEDMELANINALEAMDHVKRKGSGESEEVHGNGTVT